MNKNKFFCEIIQDFNGKYYANLTIGGKLFSGLSEYVNYNALKKDIQNKTGIVIPMRKSLIFQQSGRKKYAYIDATQPCVKGSIVTLSEICQGHKPKF